MATNAQAEVVVEFLDGTVKIYPISAHKGIASKTASKSGECGVLSLWNDEESFGIPLTSIKDWTIRDLPEDQRARAAA